MADEEGPHRLNVFSSLASLSHGLNDVRQGVELSTHQTNHELVVMRIEPVAGEADIVGEVSLSVGLSNHAVFSENRSLLLMWQLGEGPSPSQGIPDGPGPLRVKGCATRFG